MAMAKHTGQRQALVAQNMANADTPGYRAKSLAPFREYVAQNTPGSMRATRPTHLFNGLSPSEAEETDALGRTDLNGNNVSLELEMVHAASVRSDHNRALAIYRASLNILRASLGRG